MAEEIYKIFKIEGERRIKISIYGKTYENLFVNSAIALSDILNPKLKKKEIDRNISLTLSSYDINTLLIDFLIKLLEESFLTNKVFLISEINVFDNFLESKLISFHVKHFREKIKFITYDNFKIEKKKKYLVAHLVFEY